jgi:hypothetical protein
VADDLETTERNSLPVPYVTPYTNKTHTITPLLLTTLKVWAVAMLEWGSLRFIDHAPVSVWISSSTIAGLVLVVLERREWLNFKNRRYFPVSLSVLMTLWIGIVGFAYYLDTPSQAAVAKVTKETAEDDRDTVVRHLVTALSERDASRRDLAATKRDLEVARAQQPQQPQVMQPPAPEDQIPINWQPDFQLNYYGDQKIAWIRFIGASTDLARIKDAYVISTLTGHKEPLDITNATNINERWKIDQIEPIPSGAQVSLIYEPKPSPPLPDFMSQWGALEFHVVYDNKEYVKIYSQAYLNSKMAREMPGVFGPHVTPRNSK